VVDALHATEVTAPAGARSSAGMTPMRYDCQIGANITDVMIRIISIKTAILKVGAMAKPRVNKAVAILMLKRDFTAPILSARYPDPRNANADTRLAPAKTRASEVRSAENLRWNHRDIKGKTKAQAKPSEKLKALSLATSLRLFTGRLGPRTRVFLIGNTETLARIPTVARIKKKILKPAGRSIPPKAPR